MVSNTPTEVVDDRMEKWPVDLIKQRYVEGVVSLDEFKHDVEHYLSTGRLDSKYAGHIPNSVKS